VRNRIATVLRVRALAERHAARVLAGAERDVRAAERLVAHRRATAHPPPAAVSLRPVELRALELQRLAGHELVTEALGEEAAAHERRAALARAWSLASMRRRSAEQLAERRADAVAAAARAAADSALDEAALLRWEAP